MTTTAQLRAAFWNNFPQFAPLYRRTRRQNDYPAHVRETFCNYVDSLARSGRITEALADRVTL